MKSKTLLLAISIMVSFGAISQNYQTVNSGIISYYENNSKHVRCIRIDSVKYNNGDSVLYPFRIVKEVSNDCFSPDLASWIGSKVIIKGNGDNLFFNKNNDSIVIKTQAQLSEKWVLCNIGDSIIIKGEVAWHDTVSFLGLTDSVKTIHITAHDKDMNILRMAVGNMSVQVSKNYGIVKILNFWLMPDYVDWFYDERMEEYELAGLSNPRVGVQNLTWFEVNNFKPNDELHIVKEFNSGAPTVDYPVWYKQTTESIIKYIGRVNYSDSIIYEYIIEKAVFTEWDDSSKYVYTHDTLITPIKNDEEFNRLSEEVNRNSFTLRSHYMLNVVPRKKVFSSISDWIGYNGNGCWVIITGTGDIPSYEYIEGLGGPYFPKYTTYNVGFDSRELVYYKKGSTTWGNPLIITSANERKSCESSLRLYPNPATDYISISIDNSVSAEVSILNAGGVLIDNFNIEESAYRHNISDYQSGIYFVKSGGDVVKFVKE